MKITELTRSFNGAGKMESYGGNTFEHNLIKAEKAIEKVKYTERIWDRSRSQFHLKNITCSQNDDWMRLRQISAEMCRKRQALTEAKFGYMEKQVEIKMKQKELENADYLQIELLEIQIARLQYHSQEILLKVEGAMKEVETLGQMHDALTERMGDITEEAFEMAQIKSHIKRAMIQSIRDVRCNRTISIGDQEYLEQCGVCVTTAFKEIQVFLDQEDKTNIGNTSLLHSFLDDFADRFTDVTIIQAEWLGYESKPDVNLTFCPNF